MGILAVLLWFMMCVIAQNSAFILNGQTMTPNPLEKYSTISVLAQDFLELKSQVQKQELEIKTLKSQLVSVNNATTFLNSSLQYHDMHDEDRNTAIYRKFDQMNAKITDLRNKWDTANSTSFIELQNLYSEMQSMSKLLQFINNSNHVGVIHNSLIRLANGDSLNSGRVEIFYDGEWGTVCDDDFNDNAAKVVCRMLGKPTENALAYAQAYFGEGTGRILFDDTRCNGDEIDLVHCHNYWLGHSNCHHSEDVGVRCG